MGLTQCRVELDGLAGRPFCFALGLTVEEKRIRESGIGQGKVGVRAEGLAEIVNAFREAGRRPLIPIVP